MSCCICTCHVTESNGRGVAKSNLETECYLDDVIVPGRSTDNRLTNLEAVMQCIAPITSLLSKRSECKCRCTQHFVECTAATLFLQHGPTKVQESASCCKHDQTDGYYTTVVFLGHFTCCTKWTQSESGGDEQEKSFKGMLLKIRYRLILKLVLGIDLACGTSSFGLGTAFSHQILDGQRDQSRGGT